MRWTAVAPQFESFAKSSGLNEKTEDGYDRRHQRCPRSCSASSSHNAISYFRRLIGHRFWKVTGTDRVESTDGFFKDLSIMGGFLLLYITGAGRYSVDALLRVTP
jgi:hypothetical protein